MVKEIKIKGEYIKLDQLLKLTDFANSGGHAKIIISEGKVIVNDDVAYERGKKIHPGDIVKIEQMGEIKCL